MHGLRGLLGGLLFDPIYILFTGEGEEANVSRAIGLTLIGEAVDYAIYVHLQRAARVGVAAVLVGEVPERHALVHAGHEEVWIEPLLRQHKPKLAAELAGEHEQLEVDMAAMVGGDFVNRFDISGRSYKVIPQIQRVGRLNPEQLKDVRVTGPNGKLVPLGTVAMALEQGSVPAETRNLRVPAKSIRRLRKLVTTTDLEGRLQLPGLDPRRAGQRRVARGLPKRRTVLAQRHPVVELHEHLLVAPVEQQHAESRPGTQSPAPSGRRAGILRFGQDRAEL